jgi:hypothetical protein
MMFDRRNHAQSSWRSAAVLERSDRIRSIHFILALVVLFLLTACTSYYEEFEDEYGYGKSSKGYKIDGTTLTDLRDEHTYNVAKVGNLYWMLDNVAYKFYRNHDEEDKADCPRPSERTCVETGFLYPGTKLDYVCPNGWRLPSYEEWEEFYNSSAFRNYSLDNDVYKGYLSGDRSLNKDGEAAYFWTNDEADGSHYRKCLSITPERGSLQLAGPCHEQWKLAVRCVLDADSYNPDSGSGSPEDGGSEQNKNEFDCSVTDGVKVVSPKGGEAFKVGETIKLVFGSDMDFGGFGVELRFNGGAQKVNLLDESIDNAVIDGETCNEYSIKLDAELGVVAASDAYIYVYPYSKQSKAGRSEIFKVYSDSPIVEEPTQSALSPIIFDNLAITPMTNGAGGLLGSLSGVIKLDDTFLDTNEPYTADVDVKIDSVRFAVGRLIDGNAFQEKININLDGVVFPTERVSLSQKYFEFSDLSDCGDFKLYFFVYSSSKEEGVQTSLYTSVYDQLTFTRPEQECQAQSSSSYSSSSETLCDPVTAHLVSLSNNMSTSQSAINFETGLAENPHITLKIMDEEAFFIPSEGVTIYEDNGQTTGLLPEVVKPGEPVCYEDFMKSVRTYDEELSAGLWLDVLTPDGKMYPLMIKKAMFESATKGMVDIVYYN